MTCFFHPRNFKSRNLRSECYAGPMTFEEALHGSIAPPEVVKTQVLLDLRYLDFAGIVRVGQLIVHRDLEIEIRAIFEEILNIGFPIFQMRPVVDFEWSDYSSMEANNCSAFNYRLKVGKTTLSAHATGRAIDINPRQNPYISGEILLPAGATYEEAAAGTLLADGPVVAAFESRGWTWGGRWESLKDFHHFEK
ncbi:M15 family peptidase [bacterium]|nr:MAG: M15 family peptidase [bacterium]